MNPTRDPSQPERFHHLTEYKHEPEFHYGDMKAYLFCDIANATGHRLGRVINWYKNNTVVENDKHFKIKPNNTLEIHRPKRNYSGVYVARHKIYDNNVPLDYDCFVRYFAKPLVLDFPTSANIQEGETLTLRCVVKGFPPAVVSWFRNGVKLVDMKNSSHVRFFELDGVANGRLVIAKTKRQEAGMYKCVAHSAHFNYSNSKEILVRVSDKMAALYPLLGILAGVIILSLLIVTHEANAKKRIKSEEAKLYRESFLNPGAEPPKE
ncbi:unnamed protein product [Candidula unifasciata]|uniref:Ig-like domain-containing protein n=1 Tax=Candidula unifasciata TaxID=100452 RepID=A0A8S3ZYM2_9EUPU|nr:unnamed protein product [Candidula unifasciata]